MGFCRAWEYVSVEKEMIATPLMKDYKRRSKLRKRGLDIGCWGGGELERGKEQERKTDSVYARILEGIKGEH